MKIRYRLLYALPLLAFLILDGLFSDLLTGRTQGSEFGNGPSPLAGYPSMLIAGCIPLSALLYKHLKGVARFIFWAGVIALGLLMAESYMRYDVLTVYPHVFQKVMVIFTLTAMYGIYAVLGRITLADLVGIIWVAILLNVTIINPKALSIGAFVNHERGLVAASVYLLILPLLYHFNSYLSTRKALHLILFFAAAASILFFQHRTVWVVSVISLFFNTLLLTRSARQRLNFKVLTPMIAIPAVILFIGVTTIAVSHPEVITKIAGNISDIENHDKQGTGEWRAVQAKSYWPFIVKHPIIGMRFKGFELPIQFYMPDQPTLVVFPDGHGHFLHSFYIDSLFYLGIVGLLLLCIPQLYIIYKLIRRAPVDPETLTWSLFLATSLVYSYSYTLPPYFYGLAGLAFIRIKQLADLAKTHLSPPASSTSLIEKKELSSVPLPYST